MNEEIDIKLILKYTIIAFMIFCRLGYIFCNYKIIHLNKSDFSTILALLILLIYVYPMNFYFIEGLSNVKDYSKISLYIGLHIIIIVMSLIENYLVHKVNDTQHEKYSKWLVYSGCIDFILSLSIYFLTSSPIEIVKKDVPLL